MRKVVPAALMAVFWGTLAHAQTINRWYAGASASGVRVAAEEVDADATSAAGAVVGVRLTPLFSLELEANQGFGELSRVYSGKVVSSAGPGASREEIERLAVTMRSDTRWKPQFGYSILAMWHSATPGRFGVGVYAGVTGTTYDTQRTMTVLDIPAGVNRTEADVHRMVPDERSRRQRGGLTGGLLVPICLTRDLNVAPELRYIYGSIGDERYTAIRGGARLLWRF